MKITIYFEKRQTANLLYPVLYRIPERVLSARINPLKPLALYLKQKYHGTVKRIFVKI